MLMSNAKLDSLIHEVCTTPLMLENNGVKFFETPTSLSDAFVQTVVREIHKDVSESGQVLAIIVRDCFIKQARQEMLLYKKRGREERPKWLFDAEIMGYEIADNICNALNIDLDSMVNNIPYPSANPERDRKRNIWNSVIWMCGTKYHCVHKNVWYEYLRLR